MEYDKGYERCAHLYDLFDKKENIGFFLHYAKYGEILDIGAGTGRIAIPIAESGAKVFCVEPSPAMRRVFGEKLNERPQLRENITLIEGSALSFRIRHTFDAAFLSGTFDHFEDDYERIASLRNIGRHLNTGGLLVFDVFLGLMKDSPLRPAGTARIGDIEYRRLIGGRMLPGGKKETTLVFETYESDQLKERIEEKSIVGITDRQRLHSLLGETGYKMRNEYGNYDFTLFKEGDPLLIVEAEKS